MASFTFAVLALTIVLGGYLYFVADGIRNYKSATATLIVLVALAYYLGFNLTGTARNFNYEWRSLYGAKVVAFYPDREKGDLYLWLLKDGELISYVFPWTPQEEDKIRKAKQEAGDEDLEFGPPPDKSGNSHIHGEHRYYPAPPRAEPPKEATKDETIIMQ